VARIDVNHNNGAGAEAKVGVGIELEPACDDALGTFIEDGLDPVTRDLVAAVLRLTALVRLDMGAAWHASPGANEALAAAVADLIAAYKPPGRAHARGGVVTAVLGLSKPEDQPDAVGRTLARHDRLAHPSPYIQATQQARERQIATAARRRATKKDDKS
jgi:hypothetical protein